MLQLPPTTPRPRVPRLSSVNPDRPPLTPVLLVLMGVAGAGKSTVGAALASALGVEFVEGDDLHPAENRARMSAGIPLTDADRAGWLRTLAEQLAQAHREGRGLVVACSALKRAYRDVLRAGAPVRFVFLDGDRWLIAERLERRRGHFMPPALLDSQFATLEAPAPDEAAWRFDVSTPPDEIALEVVARLVKAAANARGDAR
ncbi:MAG: gluconokinase [Gemmatimonadaceae bacterium]|nr:gluconokinase [Gemmatimonadaceae bacterium]